MGFVLDASVTASWFLPDEHPNAVAEAALDQLVDDTGSAPSLWWFEVRNLLIIAERRGRITRPETGQALARLALLKIAIDMESDSDVIMHLARQHRLSAYDAAYLELAIRRILPLASLDKSLAAAATAEGVPLIL
jgi:predicted nucleic acid-binding protein